MWRYDHRNGGIPGAHHGLLELADSHVELVIILFDGEHEDQTDVGTGAEIASVTGDHQAFVFIFGNGYRALDAFKHLAPDGSHFCEPFETQNIVTQVVEPAGAILPNRLLLEILHDKEGIAPGEGSVF